MRPPPRFRESPGGDHRPRPLPTHRPHDPLIGAWGTALLSGNEAEVDRIVREARAAVARQHLTSDGSYVG
jgi:hypothetical protein